MIQKKLLWLLGYNNLSIILEQERKHWLMKTDNNKQVQNKNTGDVFHGKIDNLGSDVIIESKQLPYKYSFVNDIKFALEGSSNVLEISKAAFPYSNGVNGLMFARVLSFHFPYKVNGVILGTTFHLKFEDAKECILPFGVSTPSNEVYADKWIKTTTPPKLLLINAASQYTSELPLLFENNVTNAVYYYPLSETLQPFGIDDKGDGIYEINAIDDDGYIGYPLFWFTCDNSNVGTTLTFDENNINSRNEQIFFISNEGNASAFNAKIYTGISGNCDATPDGTETSNYIIRCKGYQDELFDGTDIDFTNRAVDIDNILLINTTSQTQYNFKFTISDNAENNKTIVRMTQDIPWVYNAELKAYDIAMSYFDSNCLSVNNESLLSIFDVDFDDSIPFVKQTNEYGMAGIQMGSAYPDSDTYEMYPYDLNKFDGLPEWLSNIEDSVPEHLAMYAIHNNEYNNIKQTSGLIVDPGTKDGSNGRVYVISDDNLEYQNNTNTEYPKPGRTAARICDIPTSITQLTNAMGISSSPIIDNRYVRTEANFSEEALNKLYNDNVSRLVRPTALNSEGRPVLPGYPGTLVFPASTGIKDDIPPLLKVDMLNHNNFRETINLNPYVDITKVEIKSISNAGSGYVIDDSGECIIGGFAFTYVVKEVNDDGSVNKVVLLRPQEPAEDKINLANFNLVNNSNITEAYGTSPLTGNGTGLKLSFIIPYDYYESILPKKGEFFKDLFALVRENDGLYEYYFRIDETSHTTPKNGKWVKGTKLSEFEITSHNKSDGGVASTESYLNSIIPSIRELHVTMKDDHVDVSNLKVLQTATCINVIDKTKTPVVPSMNSSEVDLNNVVDLCKWYCDGFSQDYSKEKTVNSVRDRLKELNVLKFDSYVVWRWLYPADNNTNTSFEYGVIYHGFSINKRGF